MTSLANPLKVSPNICVDLAAQRFRGYRQRDQYSIQLHMESLPAVVRKNSPMKLGDLID